MEQTDEGQQKTPGKKCTKRGLDSRFKIENLGEGSKKSKISNRNPEIIVDGMLPWVDRLTAQTYMHMLIHPNTITDSTTERQYRLDWQTSEPLVLSSQQLHTDEMEEFKRNVKNLLDKPLSSLTYDETVDQWVQGPSDLTLQQESLISGFTFDMANQRGRGSISNILDALLKTDMMVVHNCGGSNYIGEPVVRITYFRAEDGSPKAPRQSILNMTLRPQSACQQEVDAEEGPMISTKYWVPDIVLERKKDMSSEISEPLIVEVKKGKTLTHHHEAQLKYEMIPTAVKQGQAFGMLICAKSAMLLKYTLDAPNSYLKLEKSNHNFGNDTLLADFVELLCYVKHNLDN